MCGRRECTQEEMCLGGSVGCVRTRLGFGLKRRDACRPLGVGHEAAVVREAREDGVDGGALAVGESAHLVRVG